jgi:hypothetical protein
MRFFTHLKKNNNTVKLVCCIVIIFVAATFSVARANMTAGVYKIDSDSINSGGIDYSAAGDNQIADTLGEIIVGDASTSNYSIAAGYRAMDETSVAIGVSVQNIILSPDLGGLTGGTSTGATQVTVTTDNPAGYMLSLQAGEAPTMQSDLDTIADYSPSGANPDYQMRLVSGQSMFAFTPEGPDIVDRYRDDGSSLCGVVNGFDGTNICWDGMSTTNKTIANRSTATLITGDATTLRFSVGVGIGRVQIAGTYLATSTITALAL